MLPRTDGGRLPGRPPSACAPRSAGPRRIAGGDEAARGVREEGGDEPPRRPPARPHHVEVPRGIDPVDLGRGNGPEAKLLRERERREERDAVAALDRRLRRLL